MAEEIDRGRFAAVPSEKSPTVAATVDECAQELLHLEMGALARATQSAISDGDRAAARAYLAFIDEVYRRAASEVKNTVYLSVLGYLTFDRRPGLRIDVRDILLPHLQDGLRGLEEYSTQLARRISTGRTRRRS